MEKRKYPFWSYVLAVIAGICVLIALFLTSFQMTVCDRNFDDQEMRKYHVAETTGMTQDELMRLYDEMLKYLEGTRPDLHIDVYRNGQTVEAFGEKEIAHMVDVQKLFAAGFTLRDGCAIAGGVLIVLLLVLRDKKGRLWPVLPRGFLIAVIIFILSVGFLAGAVALDFDHAFIIFHQIFFNNDFWQLDYATDLLINIVPETFSFDVIVRTMVYFAPMLLCLLAASIAVIVKTRKK